MIVTDQQIAPIDVKSRRESRFGVGDTVRVHQKITEKDKTRIQIFEGIILARKHGTEPGATFTVRRVGTDGIAVEKIFPLYAPMIDRIEVTRKTKTRRAKIYFLRGRTPKQLREKLRKTLDTVKEIMPKKPEQGKSEESQEKVNQPEKSSEEVRQESKTKDQAKQPEQEEKIE